MAKPSVIAIAETSGDGNNDWHDDAGLARVGKKAVLKRNFGLTTITAFSCTVLITWECTLQLFLLGLQNGGPAGLVYGFVIVWVGTVSVFASLSELASMAPVASGQYHWVAMLAPVRARKVLSYVTGWLTVCGWVAATASGSFLSATLIQGVVYLTHPSYLASSKNWHGTLIYWAVVLVCLFINTLVAKWLPKLEGFLLTIHILGFFAVAVPLIAMAEHSDSTFVFKTFLYEGGLPTNGLGFCIGMLGHVFALMGADAAVHMAEEIHNAPVVLPKAILHSTALNGFMGFTMVIIALYCISDLSRALAENPMYPIMSIFHQALGSVSGAAAMSSILVVMAFSGTTNTLATASRVLWAFARDRGIPGWSVTEKIDRRTGIPLNAVVITSGVTILLSFVNIGNPTAFNGVVSLTIAALYSSYFLPCALLLWRRTRGDIGELEDGDLIANTLGEKLAWGPWRLPSVFGFVNNVFACCFSLFVLFFSFWPSTLPVTPTSMNWAVLVTGVVVMVSTFYYVFWGNRTYEGPVVETRAVAGCVHSKE